MKRFKIWMLGMLALVSLRGTAQEYDSARGFIHPGGLHTQADFDRIKQQLVEGNETVTAAYNVLKSAAYSSATAATYPVETIVRGGSGENYINAARGATIAYQNALRWKIDGTTANADHAVEVLMKWANTTKAITGSSDQCLARGLYGYEFAQAAELMRDYEGWNREDFKKFQRWMLDLWYPGCIGFLRDRNGTWLNSGKWWQAPGHYWSNWGLCNALAVISIGVLCDDVFIYNQGMSFIKYDQVGTFVDPRTANPILNDGLTEFWGNLVVTTEESELETGAYGKLGQTNESGRDTGHAAMALGLAIDIAHQGWNQGDDLFSYMDHRIAAGIEYVAAQTQSVEGLPWTNYKYATNGYYYTDSRCWEMIGPALGAQMRPYWGTVIGHYEGVKGVRMPFSEIAYEEMGIDAGGQGSTSGGYDHLGYSVLMNTRTTQLAPASQVPTELVARMTCDGETVGHNELGGLTNTYQTTAYENRALAPGTVVTLSPTLPEGETDTGKWKWNTGETTREITITAAKSYVYRVTYTNSNGTQSQQSYAIAVLGDCRPSKVTQSVTYEETTTQTDALEVAEGASVTLSVADVTGYGNCLWETGETTTSITLTNITRGRSVVCRVYNQGGYENVVTFRISVENEKVFGERITTIPADPSPYFFALKDHEQELYMTLQQGVHNGSGNRTMWYSATDTPETSKDALWTFDNTNEEYQVIANANYPDYMLQTEWKNAWFYRTSDNGGNASGVTWGQVMPTYSIDSEAWTFQNGTYPASGYLGPWEGVIADGAEVALNKTGDLVGYFDLFQMLRGEYVATCEKLSTASASQPLDISYTLENPGAERLCSIGWKHKENDWTAVKNASLAGRVGSYAFTLQTAQGESSQIYQEIAGLPEGRYRFSVLGYADAAPDGCAVFANGEETPLTTTDDGVRRAVTVLVSDGVLRVGVKDNGINSHRVLFDDARLEYLGQVVLVDEASSTPPAQTDEANVQLVRTLSADYWNTFTSPFNIADPVEAFGEGTKVTELDTETPVSGNTLTFKEAHCIVAGRPYLIKPGNTVENPIFDGIYITATEGETLSVDGFRFIGVIAATPVAKNEAGASQLNYFINTSGKMVQPSASGTLKGMRAYFQIPVGQEVKIRIETEDGASSIHEVNDLFCTNGKLSKPSKETRLHDLGGRAVQHPSHGLYIKNGKKIFIQSSSK